MVEINPSLEANPSQANHNQAFNQAQPQANPKGLFQIPDKFLQMLPLLPLALEALTGQKVPAVGSLAEIQTALQQLQISLQQVLTKLTSLETTASSQLTNLSQQITSTNQSFRLLATETKKIQECSQPNPPFE